MLACSPQQVGCSPKTEEGSAEQTAEGATAPEPIEPRTDGSAIEHTLRFEERAHHAMQVETVFSAEGESLDVMMAVWTPGSYLVREFARHVSDVTASGTDGTPLTVTKIAKNRWRITTEGALPERVALRYRVYGREPTVRTNFIDAEMAILNGAPTFLVPAERLDDPHDIQLVLPDAWALSVTGLESHPDGSHRYLARDYDELVDTPIALGNPSVQTFEVEGAEHVLATFGGHGIWDDEKAGADVEALVKEIVSFWGVVPYRRYCFLNVLLSERGAGGLEHQNSTLMMSNRWAARDDEAYSRWLGLVSHEFFHTWNVKRLRPVNLGPFDYENENYVHDLWIAEGITSYYDDLLQARAGLLEEDAYLQRVSDGIDRLLHTPGRRHQSLTASSFNTWIHFYRPDENTRNSGVSYYTKGALVAWLLDTKIREASGGNRSLDDAMRLAYARYSGERGYTPEEIRAVFEEVAGESLAPFWAQYVDGTAELDFASALREFGLRFAAPPEEAEPWLGVSIDDETGRLRVRSVVRGGPAEAAGLNVDDELIAFDDERLPADWAGRLSRYEVDQDVTAVVARRGRLLRLDLTFGEKPRPPQTLENDVDSSPGARNRRHAWLGVE